VIGSSATSDPSTTATIAISTKMYAVDDAVQRWTTISTQRKSPTVPATS
jgi:hypothetical protein